MNTYTGEVLEQGLLTVKPGLTYPYYMRLLELSDLEAVMQLQSRIIAALEQKELYVPISEEELHDILTGNGESLGIFVEDKLYAACSLLFKVDYEINMARELNFSNDELAQVSQLELSLVDPVLRGAKLQQKLAGTLARREEERKTTKYLFCTASPYNYASIQTLTAIGLHIAKLCKMYYDWDRYVLYKDLTKPAQLDQANSVSSLNTSFAEQQELLSKGYRGYAISRDHEGNKIMFAPIIGFKQLDEVG